MTNQVLTQRVSPSGPLLGSPPALVGGGQVDGRCWRAQGAGDTAQIPQVVPGTDPSTLIPVGGLEMMSVDFRPGYGYDIAADVGALGADLNEQSYSLQVQLSIDGVVWVPVSSRAVETFNVLADARLHQILSPAAYPNWKFARLIAQSDAPATADLTILPGQCSLVIQEFTTA